MSLRSSFDLYVISGVICIEDRDEPGKMSVTNDADNVVQHVLKAYPKAKTIVYRDSSGNWDQLLFNKGEFTAFRTLVTKDRQDAINTASKIDVSAFPKTEDGDYLIEDFKAGVGYWNAKDRQEIRSIGRALSQGELVLANGTKVAVGDTTYVASHKVKFYGDPAWECVWLT